MRLKGIVWDWDGVLGGDSHYWASLYDPGHPFHHVRGVLYEQIWDNDERLGAWMKGALTSEQVNRRVAKAARVASAQLLEIFWADAARIRPNEPCYACAKLLLGRGIRQAICTDNMDVWSRAVCSALALGDVFHPVDNSADCGILKGVDRFLRLSDAMGLAVSELCLLDDGVKNCDAFTSVGGCAIRVDRRRPEAAVTELMRLVERQGQ